MKRSPKPGIEGALEDALARGMKLTFRPIEDIVAGMEQSIREVEAEYTPDTPARLRLGRPCKAAGKRASRMKGLRLDVAFLAELEPWLEKEQVSFSGLVQSLLGEWLKGVKGSKAPGVPAGVSITSAHSSRLPGAIVGPGGKSLSDLVIEGRR